MLCSHKVPEFKAHAPSPFLFAKWPNLGWAYLLLVVSLQIQPIGVKEHKWYSGSCPLSLNPQAHSAHLPLQGITSDVSQNVHQFVIWLPSSQPLITVSFPKCFTSEPTLHNFIFFYGSNLLLVLIISFGQFRLSYKAVTNDTPKAHYLTTTKLTFCFCDISILGQLWLCTNISLFWHDGWRGGLCLGHFRSQGRGKRDIWWLFKFFKSGPGS